MPAASNLLQCSMMSADVYLYQLQGFIIVRLHIVDITESSLTKQLRELEADGFVTRHDYNEVPPHVEYNLTDLGKSFIPVFEHMKQWGDENL